MSTYGLLNGQKLSEIVGKTVLAIVPALHANELVRLKLRSVDESGIWVEDAEFARGLLAGAGLELSERQLIFLPFSQVTLLMHPESAASVHHDLWHR